MFMGGMKIQMNNKSIRTSINSYNFSTVILLGALISTLG